MDFTKYVAMLESGCIFFPRADNLSDPFEGSRSRGNEQLYHHMYKDAGDDLTPELLSQARASMGWLLRILRRWTYISCWHMNEHESAAMWKLYAQTNQAVALKTSFSRLATEFDEDTYIGMVDYIDFENEWLPESNYFYPFVHKRRSFSHECEVRAVIQHLPINEGKIDPNKEPPAGGLERKVDLQRLIEGIHVAPSSPEWFTSIVERVTRRYGLEIPVIQSSLDASPFF